jgi:hypothetical protein
LPKTLFVHTRCAQSLKGISLSAQSLVDLTFKFLFLLGKTTELRLSHFDVIPLVLAVAIVAFSRTKMNLAHTVVFYIIAAFLDYDVSKVVDAVSEFKTSGGAVARTDSRHLKDP